VISSFRVFARKRRGEDAFTSAYTSGDKFNVRLFPRSGNGGCRTVYSALAVLRCARL